MVQCYLCDRKASKEKKISLHRFPSRITTGRPTQVNFHKLWLDACSLSDRDVVTNIRICSLHFGEEDFSSKSRTRLTYSAVPSLGVPDPSVAANFKAHALACSAVDLPEQVVVAASAEISLTPLAESDPLYICPDVPDEKIIVPCSAGSVSEPAGSEAVATNAVLVNAGSSDQSMTSPLAETGIKSSKLESDQVCSNETSPKYRQWDLPRYINEVVTPGVATPQRATATSNLVQNSDREKAFEIWKLRRQIRKLKAGLQAAKAKIRQLSSGSQGCTPQQNLPETSSLHENLSSEDRNNALAKYGTVQFKRDLKAADKAGGLPTHWTYSCLPWGVVFSYFGDCKEKARRTLFVNEDMTVEVRADGRLSKAVDLGTVKNLEDAIAAMAAVSALHLCAGVDSKGCRGEGFLRDRSRGLVCVSCRRYRRMRKLYRELVWRRTLCQQRRQTQIENLERHFVRLKGKSRRLELDVAGVRRRCAEISEAALKLASRFLPKPQQEGIEACVFAAK